MNKTWTVKDINLNFRFGIRQLYAKSIKTLILEDYLAYKSELPAILKVPVDQFTDDVKAVYLQSLPKHQQNIDIDTSESMIRYSPWEYVRHYIDLSGDYATYFSKLSANTRKNVKRRSKRFSELCNNKIVLREYKCDEISDFYSQARDISRNTYQEKLLSEGLPEDDSFKDKMMKLASDNRARGYLLFHDTRAIAYWYFQVNDDILYSLYCGYDPEYSEWSPGTVLYTSIIEKLYKDREFRIMDQGAGDFDYKKSFATGTIEYMDLMYLRNTLANKALVKLHSQWHSFIKLGNSFADKFNIKPMLKKLNKSY